MSRYWTVNSQRSVSSKNGAPAYHRDGGKILNDTETMPPYKAAGPDGPDLNRVGFPTVKAFVKGQFMHLGGGMSRMMPEDSPIKTQDITGQGGANYGAIAGKALEAIGAALDKAEPKQTESRTIEGSHNSGSAPVQTEFPGQVGRRR